ncbi:unnamed protein product [Spirodela intermedia]|uniref:Bifunctional inhibitor/plant lipid transfer protein/seed storage helical domain-containing protein n=1 Tax=Spirodela intermedia TaxID=51605 RepID=A0A7I8IHM1_SPIIN|nr:unnamed protein product [Spirodela intermedia]CAA6656583.1 unnamed protein product [Spirodela intermedia]
MTSKCRVSRALLLIFNLLFFILVSGQPTTSSAPAPPSSLPPRSPPPPPHHTTTTTSSSSSSSSSSTSTIAFNYPAPAPSSSLPTPPPPPPPPANCLIQILSLTVCAPILILLKFLGIAPGSGVCCNIIRSIPSGNLATCLCLAFRANILGLNIRIPGDITLLLNHCGVTVPIGLACP